jgi:hypothetical protein
MYNNGNSSKNVTGASVVDGTLYTVDIADDAVTADKLANTVNTDIATGVSGSTTAGDALPKTGGAMTGAITTNSTFDGVDVATRDGVLTTTTATANDALPKTGGAMTGTITNFASTAIDDNSAALAMTFQTDGNISIGSSGNSGNKLRVYHADGNALHLQGNGNAQGSAQKLIFLKHVPKVSLGTKLIIPIVSQGSLNAKTVCRVRAHTANYNYGSSRAFTAEFACHHTTMIVSLTSWGTSGNFASIAVNGMNIEITLTVAEGTNATGDGLFVELDYMSDQKQWSIDTANVAMN